MCRLGNKRKEKQAYFVELVFWSKFSFHQFATYRTPNAKTI